MPITTQKPQYKSYTLTARLDDYAYESMISLMGAAGYTDVSSFVREAVLVKCKNIADNVSGMFDERAVANKRSEYRPIQFSSK
tara:strand:- start:378 stop:626 length:249 start_codon:yes stop_codon:yes gene_type:complete